STHVDPISTYRAELRRAARRLNRARRRRVLIASAAALSVVVTGSLAVAARNEGWLTGEPAPPAAIQGFGQYTTQLGFHPEAGKAQFVAQDGVIKLYATANREGGVCYLVDEPWKPANAGDGGTCSSKEKADEPITAAILGVSASSSDGFSTMVVAGRVTNPAARAVRFEDPNGSRVERPMGAGGFYVAAVRARPLDFEAVITPGGVRCPVGRWEPTFVALDSESRPLVESKILIAQSVGCTMGGEGTPHGPYRKSN
ncbi:MAG TPA: hypothetical protein VH297_12525, partial [Gaiellaceae bacterium]